MNERIDGLLARLRAIERLIEDELDAGVRARAAAFRYAVHGGDVRFDEVAVADHRTHRRSVIAFLRDSPLMAFVSAPIIYSMLVPIVLLDVTASLYQAACFRIYGISRVRRSSYVVLDRRHLGYLNWIEKLNCDYCSYANGVAAYAREIGARTEQYWCPIKHARRVLGTHRRYAGFLEYGDAAAWKRELPVLREAIRAAK